MKPAEKKKEAAFATNATSRPNAAVTTPPTEAPIASMADHIAADSALAGTSSSADVTFGIVAVRAGSKNADAATEHAITTYAIPTWSSRRTRRRPRISTPRKRSAVIIKRRRVTRATPAPASGPTKAKGRKVVISIQAAAPAEPVRSTSNPYNAT